MPHPADNLNEIVEQFQQLTHKPERFLNSEGDVPDCVKVNIKNFYDFSKSQEKKLNNSKGLPQLLIKGFDIEQIWQEIELQNSSVLQKSLSDLPKYILNRDSLVFSSLVQEEPSYDYDDDGDEIEDDKDSTFIADKDDSGVSDDLSEKEDGNNDEEVDNINGNIYTSKKKSVVDDEFFKLDEMENFLNVEEKKDLPENSNKKPKQMEGEEESDSDDEDSINLFEEEDSDEENDKSRTAKFKDFFRPSNPDVQVKPKRNKFLEEMDIEEENQEVKSSLELRQERLQEKIAQIEENAVSEKPWTLKGEILAENRPQNSLLEEIVEFDLTARPAPVITENTTMQLEDIIRQRIKDKAFDSVVRKEKPIETPLEFKKKLLLDQEKSKHSLAQIYEKEFLDQQAALDPANADKEEEEPRLHRDIKVLMRDLFNKLDALSNFHFTPKPALPEMRVVNNMPAITMEEVAPVTANEASLLAPEEIRNKTKGDILGASEKSKTDKKRERRKKKLKQKHHIKTINKNLISKGKSKGKKTDINVLKHRNTHKMDESSTKSIKSSKAFFNQLQEQAQAHINKKVQGSEKKKNTNKLNARKIKL
ncbi:U3 small nucleolar ribonucleoprotein protein MPP10 [Diabrotica virgifera virgifera]|uniref:U3 small nucleolar ribonucleoprotein protein MPP10 n=1 Tax=Diabrotica virgifera virgifera TaxID=50390 RepID=A0A6P7GJU2_DIAVI|nr:U3 small nucleolar ribonucleoprotein protein MPP10 [Diabrotica virgifera virgifera]